MEPTFRHALVTGGAGFIGSPLVRRLLDRGFRVTVLDNLSVGTGATVDPRAGFVEGDVRSRNDVERALQGVDCVFHLAARVTIRGSITGFYEDVETNVLGTMNLVRCLDARAVRRFILASSMAVYADATSPEPISEGHRQEPISPYGVGKLAAERLCAQVLGHLGIPFSALRYFNTFGPGQMFNPYVGVVTIFITRLLHGQEPIIFGDGEQQRDFVHVDDVVSGTVASANGPPGIYNLGTGRGTSVNQVAHLLSARISPGTRPVYAPARPGELRFSVADISAARRHLGYEPCRSLEGELDAVIATIRARDQVEPRVPSGKI